MFCFISLSSHDYQLVFGTDVSIPMTKAQRMLYGESAMTHAMVLTGVNVEVSQLYKICENKLKITICMFVQNGDATKWRVENSWGEERGDKGYLMMTTDWFKEYVFEVVVDRSLLSEEVLAVFQQEPQVLPIWDPMGTLA